MNLKTSQRADKKILLTTINAKWIHPSLALRLLKANLGPLEETCEIIEFALRQPLAEKLQPFFDSMDADSMDAAGTGVRPRILGISVSIWNHLATIELLEALEKAWAADGRTKPVVALGGPEVSHLPPDAEIFKHADYVIRGEGETAFRTLCDNILQKSAQSPERIITTEPNNLNIIKSAYHLYTDEDLAKKLIYVESSRGCPFNCEFCLSAVKDGQSNVVREFPLEPFLAEMDDLVRRGAKTFKFLDRTFNLNIKRAIQIMEFFLKKIEERKGGIVVHFEMVPFLFPPELREILARFPPETLRLEIGIQTLNPEAAARIKRPSNAHSTNFEDELETLRFLREKTNAIIHADLIAGLPGENLVSFGNGFDRLCTALFGGQDSEKPEIHRTEIQLGILKLLPGAPIARHNETFVMRYNSFPPHEVMETSAINAADMQRVKNFARFWELIVNRGLTDIGRIAQSADTGVFKKFMDLSDSLFARFGRNWGIDKNELKEAIKDF